MGAPSQWFKSEVIILNRKGDTTDPCGIPLLVSIIGDMESRNRRTLFSIINIEGENIPNFAPEA